jgi:tetratricopeptide (TPR) repeat protein
MHLDLPFEPPWLVKAAPNDQLVAILPGGKLPVAIVTYGPIIIRPDEPKRWRDQVVRSDLPADAKVELGRTIERETQSGWPMTLVEATATTPDGTIVECRLCALYTFMEHGSVAIVRTGDRASMATHGNAILDVLERGRPDWRGEPACLAEVWDLEVERKPQRAAAHADRVRDDAALETALAELDTAIAANPTAADHVRRGGVLLDLRRPDAAIAAFDAAIEIDPRLEVAHYYRGVALGAAGRHLDAIAAWDRAIALAPDRVDSHYNVAQAKFIGKDYAGALETFRKVTQLDPADLAVQRKVIQCLYALGRFDEGQAARIAFRAAWETSTDPRARFITEYVFDQFEGSGIWVHAIETLRPQDPSLYPVLAFRAMQHDGDRERALPASVLIETSDQAKSAGTPFVLAVQAGSRYRVLGATQQLPLYPQLKADALKLIGEALAAQPSAH